MRTLTIFYLIDLAEDRILESYTGYGTEAPKKSIRDAEKRSKTTGHSCSVALSQYHSHVDLGWKPSKR